MADMMASGQVGLLLSPKWQLSSSHVYPTIGRTKGFYFILFSSHIRRMDYFPPSVNVAAEHVIILMMLSHTKRNVYGARQVKSGQVRFSV